jgi:hypothetical protein
VPAVHVQKFPLSRHPKRLFGVNFHPKTAKMAFGPVYCVKYFASLVKQALILKANRASSVWSSFAPPSRRAGEQRHLRRQTHPAFRPNRNGDRQRIDESISHKSPRRGSIAGQMKRFRIRIHWRRIVSGRCRPNRPSILIQFAMANDVSRNHRTIRPLPIDLLAPFLTRIGLGGPDRRAGSQASRSRSTRIIAAVHIAPGCSSRP